ncbi:MAG: hypothetical protein ACYCPT_06695 [Acidimicrobiales bacterium]
MLRLVADNVRELIGSPLRQGERLPLVRERASSPEVRHISAEISRIVNFNVA